MYGSGENVCIAIPPPSNASASGGFPGEDDDKGIDDDEYKEEEEEEDSMMELERPGEEKKKRWEANTVAKSGVPVTISDSGTVAAETVEGWWSNEES